MTRLLEGPSGGEARRPRDAVVEPSFLLALADADALHLLGSDPHHDWHVTPLVREALRSEPARSEVSQAILDGRLRVTEIATDEAPELRAFAGWAGRVDAGEAEALAVATSRSWVVGVGDAFVRRELDGATIVTVPSLLAAAGRGDGLRDTRSDVSWVTS